MNTADERRPIRLEPGKIYRNRGGGRFRCLQAYFGFAIVQNVKSGWMCTVHDLVAYPDGAIEWGYSTDGRFSPLEDGDAP